MTQQIYFDATELSRGKLFTLLGEITSEEGHSYELEEWLGRGGHAAVYRCRDRVTGEECAAKFLLTPGAKSAKRFSREVKLLKRVAGDHITRYHGRKRHAQGQCSEDILPFEPHRP